MSSLMSNPQKASGDAWPVFNQKGQCVSEMGQQRQRINKWAPIKEDCASGIFSSRQLYHNAYLDTRIWGYLQGT